MSDTLYLVEEKKITIDPHRGLCVVSKLTDSEYAQAANWLLDKNRALIDTKKSFDRYLGQLILSYAAERETDWADAISRLNLVQDTNKAFKTLLKLPRLVTYLPDEAFELPNLTTTNLDTACSFGGPEEPEKYREFSDKRMEVLRHVSEHPEESGNSFISQRMRALQEEMGVKPNRKEKASEVQLKFILTSLMLIGWIDEDYLAFGVTRGQTRDHWEGYKADLIDRGIIPEDDTNPVSFCPPWRHANVVEADIVTEDPPRL